MKSRSYASALASIDYEELLDDLVEVRYPNVMLADDEQEQEDGDDGDIGGDGEDEGDKKKKDGEDDPDEVMTGE